jgi:uncharacterized protein
MSSAPTGSDRLTYIDSSALVKAVLREPESDDLLRHFRQTRPSLIASSLLKVETMRAIRQVEPTEGLAELNVALEEIVLVAVTESILRRAATVEPAFLRSLDAVHLATALDAGAEAMIVYDRRLADAARAHGLTVMSPGA